MLALAVALLMQATPGNPAPAHHPAAQSFEVLSRQADEARDAKRFGEALALYRKALKLRPGWADGLWEAGSIEYDQDQYKECSADFERLAALKPDQPPGWTMAGLCEYHFRDYNAALKSLLQAQQLGFKEGTELARAGRLHMALVLIKLNNFEKAITTLMELTRIDRKTPAIVVASGIAGLRQPWTPPEVPESERDKVFKLGDAMAAVMEQDSKEAMAKFDVVLRDYPDEPNVHFRYGAFLVTRDRERGIEEMGKTLALDPNHIPALVSLASVYLKRDQAPAARQYAEKAVKLAPGDFATHVILGKVLLDTDDGAGAVRELETAVRLAPASPESHFNLAAAYSKLGRKNDALREREEFRKLRKLTDPNEP
ncbi:MAG: tetratricopeptide repeat protein [Bryobacteraceae bacterium]|jgi:tetratricopeptide (TPR) repeat protein